MQLIREKKLYGKWKIYQSLMKTYINRIKSLPETTKKHILLVENMILILLYVANQQQVVQIV